MNYNFHITKNVVKNAEHRGGASIIQIGSKVIIFGGANRNGELFCDGHVKDGDADWTQVEMSGDIPTLRSGHAVAKYGKYMFLFGGIDFIEEMDYNDLYMLDTDIWEWKYVGEAGIEVNGRNSHSLAVLSSDGVSYLVIYGGASSALGVQGDTIYATLPSLEALDATSIFVEWKSMSYASSISSPSAREMHSSCVVDDALFIIGGRNHRGEFLDDVWKLSISSSTPNWTKCTEMTLPFGRCSHGATMIQIQPSSKYLCLFGGLTAAGAIDDKLLLYELTGSASTWVQQQPSVPITGRFGLAMCSATVPDADDVIFIFGGVNADLDFNDVYLIQTAAR